MATQVDFPSFLARLRQSVDDGATVSYRFLTDDRHLVMVTLEQGRIVFLRYGAHQGLKAIPRIGRLDTGTLTTDEDPVFIRQQGLPPSAEILREWEQQASRDQGAAASTLLGIELPAGLSWNEEVKQQVVQVLKKFIGPIAPLIVDNAERQLGPVEGEQDVVRLLDILAEELEGSEDKERFYAEIQRRLA